jgi:signal transduction histidine kinase
MRTKINVYSSVALRVIFILSVFSLVLISSVSFRHNHNVSESSDLVKHTYQVNIGLEILISQIKDAETNQRGYLVTRSEKFLQPYLKTRNKINYSFAILKKLTADNPSQQENLDEIFQLTNERYISFESSIKYSNPETYDKHKLFNSMFYGSMLTDKIRYRVDRMKLIEKDFLINRQDKLENAIFLTPVFTVSISFLSILIILFSYKQIVHDIDNLKVNNKKLLISTKLMSESEKIGQFSTWHWNQDSQKITFSDNLSHLLGLGSQELELDSDVFLEFVHPNDKEAVMEWLVSIWDNNQLPFIYYKIIHTDGSIRHFRSTGKLLHDRDGKNLILGLVFDLTEEHNQNVILAEQNSELEKRTQELASFNRIASHDLQEPLRKIQTFISIIADSKNTILQEKTREYLDKIDDSAKRMRLLIDDLLLFTKTSTSKKGFVMTNLNEVLDDTLLDLSELIKEKKAIINSQKLPEISVIPYQIQQLFANLIINAVKYSKSNVPPEINIEFEKITSASYPKILDLTIENYYKFSFIDNGIGFDPKFKETIFVLFQRLHAASEFPGTGIGLAICQKIVENHKGIIIADSTPNIGSVFNVFLPV